MLNPRQMKLYDFLKKNNRYATADEFSNLLGVSSRTIYSDIKEINAFLENSDQIIKSKRGVGIRLTYKDQVLKQRNTADFTNNKYKTDNRRKEIMRRMLFADNHLTLRSLSEEFYVSESSIIHDFNFIEKKLTKNNDLTLMRDLSGTYFKGLESDYQKAMIEFNKFVLSSHSVPERLNNQIKVLGDYYGIETVEVTTEILYEYVKENISMFGEHCLTNVLNMLIVLIYRLKQNVHIEDGFKSDEQDNNDSSELLNRFSKRLNLKIKAQDISYSPDYLMSNKLLPIFAKSKTFEFVNDLLEVVSENTQIKFKKDETLKKNLTDHIIPMIYRLEKGITLENPFVEQIKTQFPVMFNLVWNALIELTELKQWTIDETEVGFLTIHFQTSVERMRINHRILVVCQLGIATSELIVNRLRNLLSVYDNIETSSVDEVQFKDLRNYDLILTTTDLEINDAKILLISPILSEYDLKNVRNYLEIQRNESTKSKKCEYSLESTQLLKHYLKPENVFNHQNFSNYQDLVRKVGQQLIVDRIIDERYLESVLWRESKSGTDLPMGVAVPHGSLEYVNKTQVYLVINNQRFKWNKYYVDLIFIIAISEKDKGISRKLMSELYDLIENQEALSQIRETQQMIR